MGLESPTPKILPLYTVFKPRRNHFSLSIYKFSFLCYNPKNDLYHYFFKKKEKIMEKIRIQDDLYTYVNQAKLDELVIPEDMPMAGGFAALSTDVEKLMIGEFNTMCKEAAYPND